MISYLTNKIYGKLDILYVELNKISHNKLYQISYIGYKISNIEYKISDTNSDILYPILDILYPILYKVSILPNK